VNSPSNVVGKRWKSMISIKILIFEFHMHKFDSETRQFEGCHAIGKPEAVVKVLNVEGRKGRDGARGR
jgi:hypothetical protein